MISKKLYKMKQKYDEVVGQGDKTMMLNESLNQMYHNVELMKNTFAETNKKIKDTLISVNDENKKNKNYKLILGQTLMSEAEKYERESLLHGLLSKLGQVIASLSIELSSYEMKIEDEFRKEICFLLDEKIATIISQKKKLSKTKLELDMSEHKLKSATSQNVSSQKQANLENDLSELTTKYDYMQDLFSIDLLNFISKEKEYAKYYISVLEAEKEYHKNSLEILNLTLPDVQKLAESSNFHPIFGLPIEQIEELHGQIISPVLKQCADYILKNGLDIEGIFRLAGSVTRIRKLKAGYDAGFNILSNDNMDIFSVCACMKTHLRDLPEPLLTYKLENEWIQASKLCDDEMIENVKKLVSKLPKPNYENLKFLICFLVKVSAHSDKNKMTSANLGIVIGPNLFWSSKNNNVLLYTSASSSIVDCMINNYAVIFSDHEIINTPQLNDAESLPQKLESRIVNNPKIFSIDSTGEESLPAIPPPIIRRKQINAPRSTFYE